MEHFPKILSTKLLDPAIKKAAMEKGMQVTEQEFLQIVPTITTTSQQAIQSWLLYPLPIAVVFTSQHAVTSVAKQVQEQSMHVPAQWQLFCLNGATLEAVSKHFPDNAVIATAVNATHLAQAIIEAGSHKEVVFFCGNQRRNELPVLLAQHAIALHEVIVYETTETAVAQPAGFDAVLFFSPSAVHSFFSINQLSPQMVCFAIGPTTAGTLQTYTTNKVLTSDAPSQESLLASVWFYFQHINHYE